jgi:hypothetical protein
VILILIKQVSLLFLENKALGERDEDTLLGDKYFKSNAVGRSDALHNRMWEL